MLKRNLKENEQMVGAIVFLLAGNDSLFRCYFFCVVKAHGPFSSTLFNLTMCFIQLMVA